MGKAERLRREQAAVREAEETELASLRARFLTYEHLSVAEARELARKIVAREVFTELHVQPSDRGLLLYIFRPLRELLYTEHRERLAQEMRRDAPGMVFEEYRKRILPRGIGGYPMFASLRFLSKASLALVIEEVSRLAPEEGKSLRSLIEVVPG